MILAGMGQSLGQPGPTVCIDSREWEIYTRKQGGKSKN
jgi:hypothetical protein